MHTRPLNPIQRAALGAVSGAGATFLMQGMMQLSGKFIPDSKPPIKEDPGAFMLKKAKSALPEKTRERIPQNVETIAAKSLHMGYGITSGALYGLMAPRRGSPVLTGALLGIGVWAAGYLGWLPAADLMPPITEHEPRQVIVPIVEHALFGVAVAAAYDGMASVASRSDGDYE
jgi:hypothetical protein